MGWKRSRIEAGRRMRHRRKLWAANPICYYCQLPIRYENSSLDHQIPIASGGPSHTNNYVLACKTCNNRKGSKTAEEFLTEIKKENLEKNI